MRTSSCACYVSVRFFDDFSVCSNVHSSDGGGIRGLATLHQISEIMREVNKDTQSELRPCDIFDVIAGVGVGG
jgi:patatin-like phospholipase/acyl hydrolase